MEHNITIKQLQQYRDNEAVSQSELKALLNGKPFSRKPSFKMLLGNYLDCMLLTPHLIHEVYFVSDVERPTQTIQDLCDSFKIWYESSVPVMTNEKIPYIYSDLSKLKNHVEEWIQFQSYYNNRPNTRVDKFIEEAKEWWSVLVQKGNRDIITLAEAIETELTVSRLKDDTTLKWLWQEEFQKPFYWTEQGIDCKGLGDICGDDYVDLKRTECETIQDWWKVCAGLNYPFQMAFYKSGLGFNKGYWLVVNKNWHQLIEVSELMFQIGKWGYNINKEIQVGKVVTGINKKVHGYIDGLNLMNGTVEETNDLFLTNLNV